jgi:hypothetical protein
MIDKRFRWYAGRVPTSHDSMLYRQLKTTPRGGHAWVWRDALPDERGGIEFEDVDGHPVDIFGLPLFGSFIDIH